MSLSNEDDLSFSEGGSSSLHFEDDSGATTGSEEDEDTFSLADDTSTASKGTTSKKKAPSGGSPAAPKSVADRGAGQLPKVNPSPLRPATTNLEPVAIQVQAPTPVHGPDHVQPVTAAPRKRRASLAEEKRRRLQELQLRKESGLSSSSSEDDITFGDGQEDNEEDLETATSESEGVTPREVLRPIMPERPQQPKNAIAHASTASTAVQPPAAAVIKPRAFPTIADADLPLCDKMVKQNLTERLCTAADAAISETLVEQEKSLINLLSRYKLMTDVSRPRAHPAVESWLKAREDTKRTDEDIVRSVVGETMEQFLATLKASVKAQMQSMIARKILNDDVPTAEDDENNFSSNETKAPVSLPADNEEFVDDLEDDVFPPLFEQLEADESDSRAELQKESNLSPHAPLYVSLFWKLHLEEDADRRPLQRQQLVDHRLFLLTLLQKAEGLERNSLHWRFQLDHDVVAARRAVEAEEISAFKSQLFRAHRIRLSLFHGEEEASRNRIVNAAVDGSIVVVIEGMESLNRLLSLRLSEQVQWSELRGREAIERETWSTIGMGAFDKQRRELLQTAESQHRSAIQIEEFEDFTAKGFPAAGYRFCGSRLTLQLKELQWNERLVLEHSYHIQRITSIVHDEQQAWKELMTSDSQLQSIELKEDSSRFLLKAEEHLEFVVLTFSETERNAFEREVMSQWRTEVHLLQHLARLAPSFRTTILLPEQKQRYHLENVVFPQFLIVASEIAKREPILREALTWYPPVLAEFKATLIELQRGQFKWQREQLCHAEQSARSEFAAKAFEVLAQLSFGNCGLYAVELAEQEARAPLVDSLETYYWNDLRRKFLLDCWTIELGRHWDWEDYERLELEMMHVVQQEHKYRYQGLYREEQAAWGVIALQVDFMWSMHIHWYWNVLHSPSLCVHTDDVDEDWNPIELNTLPWAMRLKAAVVPLQDMKDDFENGVDDPYLGVNLLQWVLHRYFQRFVENPEIGARSALNLQHRKILLMLEEERWRKAAEYNALDAMLNLYYTQLLLPAVEIEDQLSRRSVKGEEMLLRQHLVTTSIVHIQEFYIRRFLQTRYLPSLRNLWQLEHSDFVQLRTARDSTYEETLEVEARRLIEQEAAGLTAMYMITDLVERLEPSCRTAVEFETIKAVHAYAQSQYIALWDSVSVELRAAEELERCLLAVEQEEDYERVKVTIEYDADSVEAYCAWEELTEEFHTFQLNLLQRKASLEMVASMQEEIDLGSTLFFSCLAEMESTHWHEMSLSHNMFMRTRGMQKLERTSRELLEWGENCIYVSEISLPNRLAMCRFFTGSLLREFLDEASTLLKDASATFYADCYTEYLEEEFAFFPVVYFLFEESTFRPQWSLKPNWVRMSLPNVERTAEQGATISSGERLSMEIDDPVHLVPAAWLHTTKQAMRYTDMSIDLGGLELNEHAVRSCGVEVEEMNQRQLMYQGFNAEATIMADHVLATTDIEKLESQGRLFIRSELLQEVQEMLRRSTIDGQESMELELLRYSYTVEGEMLEWFGPVYENGRLETALLLKEERNRRNIVKRWRAQVREDKTEWFVLRVCNLEYSQRRGIEEEWVACMIDLTFTIEAPHRQLIVDEEEDALWELGFFYIECEELKERIEFGNEFVSFDIVPQLLGHLQLSEEIRRHSVDLAASFTNIQELKEFQEDMLFCYEELYDEERDYRAEIVHDYESNKARLAVWLFEFQPSFEAERNAILTEEEDERTFLHQGLGNNVVRLEFMTECLNAKKIRIAREEQWRLEQWQRIKYTHLKNWEDFEWRHELIRGGHLHFNIAPTTFDPAEVLAFETMRDYSTARQLGEAFTFHQRTTNADFSYCRRNKVERKGLPVLLKAQSEIMEKSRRGRRKLQHMLIKESEEEKDAVVIAEQMKRKAEAQAIIARWGRGTFGSPHWGGGRVELGEIRSARRHAASRKMVMWFRRLYFWSQVRRQNLILNYRQAQQDRAVAVVHRYYYDLHLIQAAARSICSHLVVRRIIAKSRLPKLQFYANAIVYVGKAVLRRIHKRRERDAIIENREFREGVLWLKEVIVKHKLMTKQRSEYKNKILAPRRKQQKAQEKLEERVWAATFIQATRRRVLATRKVESLKHWKELLQSKDKRRKAVLRIQRWWFKAVLRLYERRREQLGGVGPLPQVPAISSIDVLRLERSRMAMEDSLQQEQRKAMHEASLDASSISAVSEQKDANPADDAAEAALAGTRRFVDFAGIQRSPRLSPQLIPLSPQSSHAIDRKRRAADDKELAALDFIDSRTVKAALRKSHSADLHREDNKSPTSSTVSSSHHSRVSSLRAKVAAAQPAHRDPGAAAGSAIAAARSGGAASTEVDLPLDGMPSSRPYMRHGPAPIRRYHEWAESDYATAEARRKAQEKARMVAKTIAKQTSASNKDSDVPDQPTRLMKSSTGPQAQARPHSATLGGRSESANRGSANSARMNRPHSAGAVRPTAGKVRPNFAGRARTTEDAPAVASTARHLDVGMHAAKKVLVTEEVDLELLNEAVHEAVAGWAEKLSKRKSSRRMGW